MRQLNPFGGDPYLSTHEERQAIVLNIQYILAENERLKTENAELKKQLAHRNEETEKNLTIHTTQLDRLKADYEKLQSKYETLLEENEDV